MSTFAFSVKSGILFVKSDTDKKCKSFSHCKKLGVGTLQIFYKLVPLN
jgi:hypothetical protein